MTLASTHYAFKFLLFSPCFLIIVIKCLYKHMRDLSVPIPFFSDGDLSVPIPFFSDGRNRGKPSSTSPHGNILITFRGW
jgi:hypothetical protein